jgi:phosphoglycerate dehydrogenase-like enzyme
LTSPTEPLPENHPLWTAPHCIITPHTADPWDMVEPRFAKRIGENVARWAADRPLIGLIDRRSGY